MFRETVSGADGTYFVSGIVPGRVRDHRRAAGIQEVRPPGHAARDRQDRHGRRAARGRRARGNRHRVGRVAARRRDLEGSRRQHHRPRARRSAVDQPQLHRLHRPAARDRAEHQHRVVRLRLDLASTAPTRATTTTCSTAATTTTTSSGSAPAPRRGRAIESVQEFQVITNQFDAQFGRTTGAIINAVTKSGTNDFHGSAFAFAQDADWTAKDYFVEGAQPQQARHQATGVRRHDRRPDRQGQGALLRQPRARHDRPRRGDRHPEPARPELEPDDAGPRVEHDGAVRSPDQRQPHLGRPLAARAVAAAKPGDRPASGIQVASGAIREEDDKDQTVVATLSSVFGSTKLNSLRAGWTQEDVAFANPASTANGRDQVACDPTLTFQTFTDQQANVAQARVNDALPDRGHVHLVRARTSAATTTSSSARRTSTSRRTTSRRTT